MGKSIGSANLAASLNVLAGAPLDSRLVVDELSDLTASGTFDYFYEGMPVYVKSETKLYILIGSDPTESANWKEMGAGGGGGGTSDYTELSNKPQINGTTLTGNKTTSDLSLPDSLADMDDVALTDPTDGQALTYDETEQKWVNSTIETSVDELNDIGDVEITDVEDGQVLKWDDTSSKWVNGSGGSSGGGSTTKAITAAIDVGGISEGTSYPIDTPLEDILADLLEPTLYPTLTAPSATLAATGAKLLESGSTLATTFTITFSRGGITPAYGTSGHRSGAASTYTLDGTTQDTNTFSRTITSAKTSYQGSVAYAAGEQPKDSKGNDYDSPLAAGSVDTNTITYEFVNALYANTANITTVAKLALVSKSAKVKEFSFPAQTVANPHEFHVDASWTVTSVEVLNTLSNQWENCASEFNVSNTTHEDAGGNTVNYKKYVCNLGVATGDRKIRIKWS